MTYVLLKLIEDGIKCEFIEGNNPENYGESFEAAGKVLQDKVKNIENKTLMDIHIGSDEKKDKNIDIVLASNAPNYKENLRIAKLLLENLKYKDVECDIFTYTEGMNMYNQNLAKNGVMINVGSNKLNEKDIQYLFNILGESIKDNIDKL